MYFINVKLLLLTLLLLQPSSISRNTSHLDVALHQPIASRILRISIAQSMNMVRDALSVGVSFVYSRPPRPAETLFTGADGVSTLTSDNFTSIHGQTSSHLMLFYAIWCGHCKAFAPNYRSLALDVASWKPVVQLGSVNCADPYNTNLCRAQNVMAYPTLKFFPPFSSLNDKGSEFIIETTTVDSMRSTLLHAIVQYIKSTSPTPASNIPSPTHSTLVYPGNSYPSTWPDLMPVNATSLSELLYLVTLHRRISSQLDNRQIIIIIEPYNSAIGSEVILDLSGYQKYIKIYRVIYNLASSVINELISSTGLNTRTVPLPLVLHVVTNDSNDQRNNYYPLNTSSEDKLNGIDATGRRSNYFTINGSSYKLILLTNSSTTTEGATGQVTRSHVLRQIVSRFLADVWIDPRASLTSSANISNSHQVINGNSTATQITHHSNNMTSPGTGTDASSSSSSTKSPGVNDNVNSSPPSHNPSLVSSTPASDVDDENIDPTDTILMETEGQDVHIVDLHNALRYSLYQEVLLHTNISSSQMDIIKRYLTLLNRYFPFTNENVRRFIRRMSQWSNLRNVTTAESFQAIMKAGSEGFLPQIQKYMTCRGSNREFRGYPCALWLLFHTLTVSEYKSMRRRNVTQHEVLPLMREYITTFFTCKSCSNHFSQLTSSLSHHLPDQNSSVLFLWKLHNAVSETVAGLPSEDPLFPKQPYPSLLQCPLCRYNQSLDDARNTNNVSRWSVNWDFDQVLAFLTSRYDRTRIIRKTFPSRAPSSSSAASPSSFAVGNIFNFQNHITSSHMIIIILISVSVFLINFSS